MISIDQTEAAINLLADAQHRLTDGDPDAAIDAIIEALEALGQSGSV